MTSKDLRQKYLDFFSKRGHIIITSTSLVPENDPTTLFTSSGMQPLIPYLLGQPHPAGKRLVDVQRCLRAQDIEEVGDGKHDTFFEMLGNWSLGDYFKKEQLYFFFEFLTGKKEGLGLDPSRLYVSVFAGSEEIPKDEESIKIWQEIFQSVGIEAKVGERIFAYGVDKNWWSRSGTPDEMPVGEIGGVSSETFFDFGDDSIHQKSKFKDQKCHPNCDCGRFIEIGNSVFIQYLKQPSGKFAALPQKNVDFGGGLERLLAACQDLPDIFQTDLFWGIIKVLENSTSQKYQDPDTKIKFQIIADHIKAATFLILDGVRPANKAQGYILRRLLRRSAVKIYQIRESLNQTEIFNQVIEAIFQIYDGVQDVTASSKPAAKEVINQEISRFDKTLNQGLKELDKRLPQVMQNPARAAEVAFDLYQSFGIPIEIIQEIFQERGTFLSLDEFRQSFQKHQELSRHASTEMFKGGLADKSDQTTRLHTATHLLHQVLRTVLGSDVSQKGSNITPDRLRFDFSHSKKLTDLELKRVEDLVNEKIKQNLTVSQTTMDKDQALRSGALGFFKEKYQDQVLVYRIGDFSKEICGGPHVKNTQELGHFKITKEEAAGAGIRRIYAILD